MVPEGWSIRPLREADVRVIDGDRGKAYPASHNLREDGFCLFLSAKNVTKNGFVFREQQFVTEQKHEEMRKGTLARHDIVLATRGTVGNVAYYGNEVPYDCIRINSGMVIIRNTSDTMTVDFLYLLMRSPVVERQIEKFTFGSAQPQLTVKIINNLLAILYLSNP